MNPAIAWIVGSPDRPALDGRGWLEVLRIADRTLSTPLLRDRSGLPDWVREEVEARIDKVAQRRGRLLETYADAARALERGGVEFVLLKGFTHEADAGVDPGMRAQGDIDLLCHPRDIPAGHAALIAGGFYAHGGRELSDNHGRPFLKPHSWQWHGDYFDPTQPVPVELHHTIWSAARDRIGTPGTDAFWDRREWMETAGLRVPVFCGADRVGTAALHLLRHVLHDNLRPGHAWELAAMLGRRFGGERLWDEWTALHSARLRRLQSVAFQFATLWFGGQMPPAALPDWDALPDRVHAWFATFALSPLESLTQPNKDVLWLHLALLVRLTDRIAVARQRLLPLRLPAAEEATGSYLEHVAKRGRYHALTLAGALWRATVRSKTPHTSD